MSEEKSIIDEELAKEFLDDPDNVDISKATEITDEAAETLSKHEGDLYLFEDLTIFEEVTYSLSDAAAESLSKHKGGLYFGGLASLSNAAAESLSKHGGWLSFDGLTSLTDTAAESLSKHEGDLHFGVLDSLTDAAAESLSKKTGKINDMDPKEWVESLHATDVINGGKEQVQGGAFEPKSENNSIFIRKRENYTAYLASEPLEVNVGFLRKCDPPYKGNNHEKLLDYLNEHCFASGSGGDWFARNQEVYGDDIRSLSLEDVELKEFGGSYEKYQDTWHEVGRPTGEVGNKYGDFEIIASNIP